MKKILIIEDNRETGNILKEILIKEGYDVKIANDGVTGVLYSQKELPDLILLDLLLPKISGFDIANRLAENDKTRKIPVIVISTLADEKQSRDKLKKCEIIKFMKKPYNIEDLMLEIKALLKSKDDKK
ncbi:MAG: response regulator [Elusimicrobiales bacterium]|jgi:DNA-binding response OmpR family regulator|nr:response regulator [Elusimicrobiales bacterium]NLH39262.1 response regulator [Elusimicrobiota bacterium]